MKKTMCFFVLNCFFVAALLFLLPAISVCEVAEVSSYTDLSSLLNENRSDPILTLNVTGDITVTDKIIVHRSIKELTINLNGHTISGSNSNKTGFLEICVCKLTIQNSEDEPSDILDADFVPRDETINALGSITNFNTEGLYHSVIEVRRFTGPRLEPEVTIVFNGVRISNCSSNTGSIVHIEKCPNAVVSMKHCQISECKANAGAGGVIYFEQTTDHSKFQVNDCIFKNNATDYFNGNGGVVSFLSDRCHFSTVNCLFEGNKACNGGAVYDQGKDTLMNISSSCFKNNECMESGGAIYKSNTHATGTELLIIDDSSFIGNSAGEDCDGGAIYFNGPGDTGRITNSLFRQNKAYSRGGAIYSEGVWLLIKNCNFDSNSAYGEDEGTGGAVHYSQYSSFENCNFQNNTACYGGALGSNIEALNIVVEISKKTVFMDNHADVGGALYVYSSGEYQEEGASLSLLLDDFIFERNQSKGSGGAVYIESDNYTDIQTTIRGGTIAYNSAGLRGGGIAYFREASFTSLADLEIINTRIYNNRAENRKASDVYLGEGINLKDFPDAATYNVQFKDTERKIRGWFDDDTPRYDVDSPTIQYTVEEIKQRASVNGISLIAAPVSSSKIIYHSNGGEGTMPDSEGTVGEIVYVAECVFSYPSFEFIKWNTEPDGTGEDYWPGDAYTLTDEEPILYAQWKEAKRPEPFKYSFTFTKVWKGKSENGINWKLHDSNGKIVHTVFNRTKATDMEWRYEGWFDTDDEYYVIEDVPEGYYVRYLNVGDHAQETDRCYNGGTIINTVIPPTGDRENLKLWACLAFLGLIGLMGRQLRKK